MYASARGDGYTLSYTHSRVPGRGAISRKVVYRRSCHPVKCSGAHNRVGKTFTVHKIPDRDVRNVIDTAFMQGVNATPHGHGRTSRQHCYPSCQWKDHRKETHNKGMCFFLDGSTSCHNPPFHALDETPSNLSTTLDQKPSLR